MSRPWSPVEVEEKIPQVVDALHEFIGELERLGERAAEAKHHAKKAAARAWVAGPEGRNGEERAAHVSMTVDPEFGASVLDLEFAADLADREYRSTTTRIRVLEKEADLLQTMHVSHRAAKA